MRALNAPSAPSPYPSLLTPLFPFLPQEWHDYKLHWDPADPDFGILRKEDLPATPVYLFTLSLSSLRLVGTC